MDYYCVKESDEDFSAKDSSNEFEDNKFSFLRYSFDEDEFENEMNQELQERLFKISEQANTNQVNEHMSNQMIPLESNSIINNENTVESNKALNEVLFYDPNADDEDEKWINNIRNHTVGLLSPKNKVKSAFTSDANLNCPCCMTLLCLDCQRHETYRNQYRAMLVINCKIDWSKKMEYKKEKKKRKNKNLKNDILSSDIYYEVKCNVCDTVVAVYDKDEVYHFFNTLASF